MTEKYEKSIKDKNFKSFKISEEIKINIKENKESSNKFNDNDMNNEITKPLINKENEIKKKHIKQLLYKKQEKMKNITHRSFLKFYYNGIIMQKNGKNIQPNNIHENNENKPKNIKKEVRIKIDYDKDTNNEFIKENDYDNVNDKNNEIIKKNDNDNDKDTNNEIIKKNDNDINNEVTKKNDDDINKEEEKKLKQRLRKSRSLRRILIKKAREKKEILKTYFYRFYQAGIIAKFKKQKRRKSCIINSNFNLNLSSQILINKSDNKLMSMAIDEKKELDKLKEKMRSALLKLVYKKDRKNAIIMKKSLQKFYLKAKYESVKNIIDKDKDKDKDKSKKKKKKKHKKKDDNVPDEIKTNNNI